MNSYTFDSSILIGMERIYPRPYFEGLWGSIEDLIVEGRACICTMVGEELKRGTDDLHSWAKSMDGFIHPPRENELEVVSRISSDHPGWVVEQRNAADPFVIAHALGEGSIVVTQETKKGPGTADHNLKIPNVADEHSVDCIDFFGLMRAEEWRF